VLVNVAVAATDGAVLDAIAHEVEAAETALGDRGRVLVRASGTEPLVRVMVEAVDAGLARDTADALAAAVRRSAGGPPR
jgi:phosphoglucosamine mutase